MPIGINSSTRKRAVRLGDTLPVCRGDITDQITLTKLARIFSSSGRYLKPNPNNEPNSATAKRKAKVAS